MLGLSLLCVAFLVGSPQDPAVAANPSAERLPYSTLLERLHDYRWMVLKPRPGEGVQTVDEQVEAGQSKRFTWQGPAALGRIWLSQADGELRFYVDGADAPTLTWNIRDFANGQTPDYLPMPMGMVLGSGWDCHLPLPFHQSLDVEYVAPPTSATRLQLEVRHFGSGVDLPSISSQLLGSNLDAIQRVAEIIRTGEKPTTLVKPDPFRMGAARHYEMKPDDEVNVGEYFWAFTGKGMLRWLDLKFIHDVPPAAADVMLRSLVLRIELHMKEPQKPATTIFRVPLGDFFGSAPGVNPFDNYLCGYDPATNLFHFRLPIPFEDGMRLVLESDLKDFARFGFQVGLDVFSEDSDLPSMRLYSAWVRGKEAGGANAAKLQIDGPARLAGFCLSTTSPTLEPLIQDGAFAFAGSLAGPTPYSFEQVTLHQGPFGYGNRSMVRRFALDAPTSADGLEFSPQVRFPEGAVVDYSALAWWYAPEGTAFSWPKSYSHEERLPAEMPEPPFFLASNAQEAELAQNLRMSEGGSMEIHGGFDLSQAWSRMAYLHWNPGAAQNILVFPFALQTPGNFRILTQFAKGPEYGDFEVLLDGRRLGEIHHATADALAPSGEVEMGQLRLMARDDHTLAFRSLDGKPLGIDYFRLESVASPDK